MSHNPFVSSTNKPDTDSQRDDKIRQLVNDTKHLRNFFITLENARYEEKLKQRKTDEEFATLVNNVSKIEEVVTFLLNNKNFINMMKGTVSNGGGRRKKNLTRRLKKKKT